MPLEVPLTAADRVAADGPYARLELDDLVDEAEWRPVWDDRLDGSAVHHAGPSPRTAGSGTWASARAAALTDRVRRIRAAIVGDVVRPPNPMTSARFGQLASVLPDCTSTQDIVRAVAGTLGPEGFIAVADHQTAGRGRRGRTWADEPGESLMLSLLLRPDVPVDSLAPLALVAGIAVAEALPIAARLRWPNDVVIGGAKVAGILAELETPARGDPYVVLGIGINVNIAAAKLPATDRLPATSLLVETGERHDRLTLLLAVTTRLQAAYREWEELGFSALFDRFRALDDLAGREVEVQLGDELLVGLAAGVDESGRLVVAVGDEDRRVDAGEVVRVV